MHHLISKIIPTLRSFTDWHIDGSEGGAYDFSIIEDFCEKLFCVRFIHHRIIKKAPVFRKKCR